MTSNDPNRNIESRSKWPVCISLVYKALCISVQGFVYFLYFFVIQGFVRNTTGQDQDRQLLKHLPWYGIRNQYREKSSAPKQTAIHTIPSALPPAIVNMRRSSSYLKKIL